ncbi:L-ascorbate metabolism protein UlaG, beta-lactamase superfamily [Natronincola peptidivorans]|uniref:L-ascorbate metabolism protein UlaG, beta-lactamase superfamily n=1 Tax=Natronincola peptidivorans TaxID=426128 RepID=A0A1I0AUQ0_9FIRM|nr:L-ascorbate metabolism protein UlaG, beta-lactamase superfamily [Natronincola peptidivorans]
MSVLKNKVLIGVIVVFIGVVGISMSIRPLYRGPISDHFDGSRFYYKETNTILDMVKWLREMETVPWPDWIEDPPQPKPEESVGKGELKITFINHATVLIQMDSINILTDPIWSERAGPISWLGTKRVRAPGIAFEELPKIDVVLISHDHYDHLDLRTLNKLIEEHDPQILVGLGVKSVIGSRRSSNITELDWWQDYSLPANEMKFTFVPARHSSGRFILGGNRTLWGGFVIEGSEGNVYFAGDTAYDEFLHLIKERFEDFRLTILPIGSYEKRWYMMNQHMNPDDAVKAHLLLESNQSAGMHFATFIEHPEQTIDAHEKDLAEALKKYNLTEEKFWILSFGEGRYVP